MKNDDFAALYTRDSQGFYVRNEKLPSKILTYAQIIANVRSLLEDASNAESAAPPEPTESKGGAA